MTNEIELINGSWVQTFTSILNDINSKLNDTEIDDIIRNIDDKISDEEILSISNTILNKLYLLENNNIDLSDKIDLILDRVNSISFVKEIVHCKKPRLQAPRHKFVRIDRPKVEEKPVEETSYVIDMSLTCGYSEPYKVWLDSSVFTYDWRLTWLVRGNKRRLLYKTELTDDIISIYKKLGITDINIIKKARLQTYDNKRT